MKKRIMSLMLTLCMVCALLPAAVAPAAAAVGKKELSAAKEVIEKNITEIALSNETTEEALARTLTAMLPEGNQVRILIEFASFTPATTEKEGRITCKWFLYDGTKVGMDYLSSGTELLTIPVAKPDADDAAMLAADKAAITAAFAEYFATANINEGNILAQKRNLQAIIDDEVQYCTEARFLNGGSGFSTDVKKGFIRGAFLLRLGGEYEEVALDVTINPDGSAVMNAPGGGTPSFKPGAVYLNDPRCVNIGVDEAEWKYRNGEKFVLIVCTSGCSWCNQMKSGLPATLSAANYSIFALVDDDNKLNFFWNFTELNSVGTPYAVLVNGKNDVEVISSVRSQEAMTAVLEKAKEKGIPSADGTVVPPTPSTPAIPATGTAYPSTQAVTIDGKKVEFQMYALKDASGNPTNYVKVRDLALALNGTKAQFAVDWDGAVNLAAGKGYAANGSENSTPFSGERSYTLPANPTKVNGAASDLTAIVLTDDADGGYTYYKLRDLGSKLGFNVDWSADKGIFIETDKPYSGN